MRPGRVLYKTGQITGVVSGIAACLIWMLVLWHPDSVLSFSALSFTVGFIMILIAVAVVIASTRGHSTMLLILFAVSFLPIGLYVLSVPHWLRWVGLANLGYLLAALLIWRFRPGDEPDRARTD